MRAAKIGRALSEQHVANVSAALSGKPKPPRTMQHSLRLSIACTGRGFTDRQREALDYARMTFAARGSSGFKGVYFDRRRGKFRAAIKVQRKQIHLGRFTTAIDAAKAYNAAAAAYGWPPEGLNSI